jgi:hypothetical protein
MWGWIPQFGHTVFFWSTLIAAVFGGVGLGAAFISAMVAYELSEWASRDANEAPAVFLMGSLKLEGIEAKAEGGSGSPAANKEAMHIIIGKKP